MKFELFMDYWNEKLAPLANTQKVNTGITGPGMEARKRAWKKRLGEYGPALPSMLLAEFRLLDNWTTERSWLDFDWCIKSPSNLLKLLEGKYRDKNKAAIARSDKERETKELKNLGGNEGMVSKEQMRKIKELFGGNENYTWGTDGTDRLDPQNTRQATPDK